MPDVQPVNHRVDAGSLVIRVAGTSPTADASIGGVVAFQVDDIDVDLPLRAWAEGVHDRILRIALDRVVGRESLPPRPERTARRSSTSPHPDAMVTR